MEDWIKYQLIDDFMKTTTVTPVVEGLVSVSVCIYGDFNTDRLRLTLDSIRNQKGVDVEIVLSHRGSKPFTEDVIGGRVKYIFNTSDKGERWNPGAIPNVAVMNTTGEFILTSDPDIVMYNEYYLRDCVEQLQDDPDLIFSRPPLIRLPRTDFDDFKNMVTAVGMSETLKAIIFTDDGLVATLDGRTRDLIQEHNQNKKFFTRLATYFPEDKIEGINELEYKTAGNHCGTNVLRRKHFDLVGGYPECYIHWGLEDLDLQWKLEEIFDLRPFPEGNFNIIHMDHDKSYIDTDILETNYDIMTERIWEGVYKTIHRDQKNLEKY